jgi:hypothetical protein
VCAGGVLLDADGAVHRRAGTANSLGQVRRMWGARFMVGGRAGERAGRRDGAQVCLKR